MKDKYTEMFSDVIETLDSATEKEIIGNDVYVFDWNNEPPDTDIALKLNGTRILADGNILTISAAPGVGKSAVCEAIIAATITNEPNKYDTFGFSIVDNNNNYDVKTLYIDTERSERDFWKSCERALKRAGYKKDNDKIPVKFILVSKQDTFEERINCIKKAIEETKARFIIIDNVGDLVVDVNEAMKSNEILLLLSAFIKKNNSCLIVTIHTNPNSNKSRGHLGSELLRRSESVFTIKPDRITGIKTLTMDYEYGKNRNAVDNLESSFKWYNDSDKFGYYSCDRPPEENKTDKEIIGYLKAAFEKDTKLSHTDLANKLVSISGKSKGSANNWIKKYSSKNWCLLHQDGKKYLLNSEESEKF